MRKVTVQVPDPLHTPETARQVAAKTASRWLVRLAKQLQRAGIATESQELPIRGMTLFSEPLPRPRGVADAGVHMFLIGDRGARLTYVRRDPTGKHQMFTMLGDKQVMAQLEVFAREFPGMGIQGKTGGGCGTDVTGFDMLRQRGRAGALGGQEPGG